MKCESSKGIITIIAEYSGTEAFQSWEVNVFDIAEDLKRKSPILNLLYIYFKQGFWLFLTLIRND